MNDINDIVFQVYTDLLENDYSKNDKTNLLDKVKKLYRYAVSGMIFNVKKRQAEMNRLNVFVPSEHVFENLRIAVYTVSTGKYDDIKNPIYIDKNIDYFIFTEQELGENLVWEKKEIPFELKKMSLLEQARYIKTHPHVFFQDYDLSMFIDGNVRITCDIKPLFYTLYESENFIAIHRHQTRDCIYDEAKAIYAAGKAPVKSLKAQVKQYKLDGFPAHYGLFETNIVIRKHNDLKCISVMEDWWNEMVQWTKRDQMSFTYALKKNRLDSESVLSLGNNSRRNPYFIVDAHR